MQTIQLTISSDDDGRDVRSVLRARLSFSYHAVSSLTRIPGAVLLNGGRVFATTPVHTGDTLFIEAGDHRQSKTEILPCAAPIEIVYEDEWLAVIAKPAGVASLFSLSHPESPSVPGALAALYGPDAAFHIVNRLDKGTTGLMTAAKCGYIHHLLMDELHSQEFFREYRGICVGCPSPLSGTIDLPIGREESSIVARKIRPDGAPSLTRYQVLEQSGQFALLQLLPQTGRTHQLRVHMAAIQHPLVGDWLYGTEDPALISRPALHSYRLVLRHPVSGERLEFVDPIPEDMTRLLTL